MANVYVLDINGPQARKSVWDQQNWRHRNLGTLMSRVMADCGPVLVFVHTSDDDRLDVNSNRTRESLNEFEHPFVSRCNPTAVVYFSGAPSGASHLSPFGKQMSSGHFHRFVAEGTIDETTAGDFAERITELAVAWDVTLQENCQGVPLWEMLDFDWLAETVECLVSRQLGVSHEAAVALSRGRLGPDVVAAQARRSRLTSDEQDRLCAVLRDGADVNDLASATTMLIAIGRQASHE